MYKLNINNFYLIKNIFFLPFLTLTTIAASTMNWFLQVYPTSNDFLSLVLQLSNVLIFIWDTHHNVY